MTPVEADAAAGKDHLTEAEMRAEREAATGDGNPVPLVARHPFFYPRAEPPDMVAPQFMAAIGWWILATDDDRERVYARLARYIHAGVLADLRAKMDEWMRDHADDVTRMRTGRGKNTTQKTDAGRSSPAALCRERSWQMIHYWDCRLVCKAIQDEPPGSFEGYASVFAEVDAQNEQVAKGAFDRSLESFARRGQSPPMLWHHDPKVMIGEWLAIGEDEHGLAVKGRLWVDEPAVPAAVMAWRALGSINGIGASIGGMARKAVGTNGVRVINEVDLIEISLTPTPANLRAKLYRKKALDVGRAEFIERIQEAFGVTKAVAVVIAERGYHGAVERDDAAGMGGVDDIIAATRDAFAWTRS